MKERVWRNPPCIPLLLFACILVPCLCYGAPAPEPIRTVLPNGMTIILQENHTAPVISIHVYIKVGSADERADEVGIAHVHEHMIFKGTASRGVGEIAREIEASGGETNAYTTTDVTVYYVVMASRYMDRGIDVLADLLQNASFDPTELEREKKVILEEIKQSDDSPDDRLHKTFFSTAYERHPYGRPIIGFADTIGGLSRDQVLGFYRTWYVPGNTVWVMAGDLNARDLLPVLEKRLSMIPSRTSPPRDRQAEPAQEATRAFTITRDVKQVFMTMGFHIPALAHDDMVPLDLLAQILGQGRSARLYRELKLKDRLVNSIYAYSMTPKDPGLFVVGSSLEGKDVARALPRILDEVFRLCYEPVQPEELARAKVQLESDFIYQKETIQGQGRELGYFEAMLGDLGFRERYIQAVRRTRTEDLLAVARKYIVPEKCTIGVLLPRSLKTSLKEKDLVAMVQSRDLAARENYHPVGMAERPEDVSKTTLPNGAVILIKENHEVPLVSLQAVFMGGLLSEHPENNGLSNFVGSMLTMGTQKRNAQQIAGEIESLAGTISGFSGMNSLGLSAEVVSSYFEQAMDIFFDVLLQPSFPEQEIQKKRKDILAAIKNQEDDLTHLSIRLFWRTLFPQHPYGMDPLGTLESVTRIERKDLVKFYERHAVASNVVLAIVGDIDALSALTRCNEVLGKVPPGDFSLSGGPPSEAPLATNTRTVSGEKEQVHVVVGARGVTLKNPDRYSLDVLQAVLSGQGGRLFLELRDRQSLAYSVTAFSQEGVEPGVFGVYIATSPQKFEQSLQGIREQLRRVTTEKISSQELDRAKTYLIGTFEIGLQTNAAQSASLAFNERYGLGFNAYREYPNRIEAVSADDVLNVAQRYLSADRLSIAIVTPEKAGVRTRPPEKKPAKAVPARN